jgi:hypothetical protein
MTRNRSKRVEWTCDIFKLTLGVVYLFLQKLGLHNDRSCIGILVLPMLESKEALTFFERLARSSVSVLSSSLCCALMSLRGSIKNLWFERDGTLRASIE